MDQLLREEIRNSAVRPVDPSDVEAWLEQYDPGMSWRYEKTRGTHKNDHSWTAGNPGDSRVRVLRAG